MCMLIATFENICIPVTLHGCHVWNHWHDNGLSRKLFRLMTNKTAKVCITYSYGDPLVTGGFTSQSTSNFETVYISWRHHEISLSKLCEILPAKCSYHVNMCHVAVYITNKATKRLSNVLKHHINHVHFPCVYTLRPRQMAAIFQSTFSNAFSWMKMYEFRIRFHWN